MRAKTNLVVLSSLMLLLFLPEISHSQQILINFDNLPGWLQSQVIPGQPVPEEFRLDTQFLDSYGVVFTSSSPFVAVISYHRCISSPPNYIWGTMADGSFSGSSEDPITISFFKPGNASVPACTDFVSVEGDPCGNGQPITLMAFDIDGDLVDSCTIPDGGILQVSTPDKIIHYVQFFGHLDPYSEIASIDNLTFNIPLAFNEPPVADAGGPYLAEVDNSIILDGSGSYDPDNDTLSYMWTQNEPLGVFTTPGDEKPIYTGSQAGITNVTLKVSDNQAYDSDTTLLVVYDPTGGFVTGGGWIDSPAGAYTPDNPNDDDLTGKANFGFVSKYKKGANVPTGNTEFQFKAGGLNFHSSSYDWLVVTGSNYARFKGIGTINGSGEYKFMLWAGDDDPDTFRIKIWEEDESENEDIIYDNGMDQPIGGGSIKIHTK